MLKSEGAPMEFYMCECPERAEIERMVEENEGKMVEAAGNGVICLLPYEANYVVKQSNSYKVYSYRFVLDSVALGCLQRLKDYQLGKSVKKVDIVGAKIQYTAKEDQAMREYVRDHAGNPHNMSYWMKANQELGMSRTVDSIRAHWKVLVKKAETPAIINNKSQKYQQQKLKALQHSRKDSGKSPNSDFQNLSILSKNQPLDVTIIDVSEECSQDSINSAGKRHIPDPIDSLNQIYTKVKAFPHQGDLTQPQIDEFFENLVAVCSHKAGRPLSPTIILKELIKTSGNVKQTISVFELINN